MASWGRVLIRTVRAGRRFSTKIYLGIEASCDDTAAAIVSDDGKILSNIVSSQMNLHAPFGGIVPHLAAREHHKNLPVVVTAALESASILPSSLHQVAFTFGPGLSPCLVETRNFAQMFAREHNLPLQAVNHLEGHTLVARLPELTTSPCEFPLLVLLVSGGHCLLVLARRVGEYHTIGSSMDDAPGEAFDKVARLLELPQSNTKAVSGGVLVEQWAVNGDLHRFPLPVPIRHLAGCNFSFAGLKAAVARQVDKVKQQGGVDAVREATPSICASFQRTVADHLVHRVNRAMTWLKQSPADSPRHFVVCGGVASNQYLRERLLQTAETHGISFVCPPPMYCTDNAVMIAWAAAERVRAGIAENFSTTEPLPVRSRWPLGDRLPESATWR